MVRPTQLGSTLVITGPIRELSMFLVHELRSGDLVISNQPLQARISTPSELSTRRLVKAAANYPGVRVNMEVPNVQSDPTNRRAR